MRPDSRRCRKSLRKAMKSRLMEGREAGMRKLASLAPARNARRPNGLQREVRGEKENRATRFRNRAIQWKKSSKPARLCQGKSSFAAKSVQAAGGEKVGDAARRLESLAHRAENAFAQPRRFPRGRLGLRLHRGEHVPALRPGEVDPDVQERPLGRRFEKESRGARVGDRVGISFRGEI